MRGSNVAMAAVVTMLVMMSGPASCQLQVNWVEIIPAVISRLTSLWQDDQVQFMGYTCNYSQGVRIRGFFQLYYHGTFSCPAWSSIEGSSLTQSPTGAREHAIKNFLNLAKNAGLVTEVKAKAWLDAHKNK